MIRRVLIIVPSFVLLLLFAPATMAQAGPQPKDGAWIFAFVAPGPHRPQILIDGRNPRPDGFDAGWISSPMIVPMGSKRIEAWAGDIKAKPVSVEVSTRVSPVVIIGHDIETDPDGTMPPKPVLRIFAVGNLGDSSDRYQVVYAASKNSLDVQINGRPVHLEKWAPLTLSGLSGALEVQKVGEPKFDVRPIEDGHFVVVLYDDVDGSLRHTLVPEALFTR